MTVPSVLRLPLRWRVMVLLVLLATLNVGFTALTLSEIAHVTELDRVGARLDKAAQVEERLQVTRDNQVLAIRALALTGDLDFLREYQTYRLEAERRDEQLGDLLRQDPGLRRRTDEVDAALVAWQRQVADHVEHVREVAGLGHVGLGGDYDGASSFPRGMEDVSGYPLLLDELRARRWSDDELRLLGTGNVLRALRDSERVAERGAAPS